MTRVLLVPHPHFGWAGGRLVPEPYLPLGLVSLATVLRQDGHDAEIVDINDTASGGDGQAIAEAILAEKPDVIGFSTAWSQYPATLRMAQACKAMNPQVGIILGGVHATIADSASVQAFPFIDAIVRGESERIISRVVRFLPDRRALGRIPGVTFVHDGTVVRTPTPAPSADLDQLPVPDCELYPRLDWLESVPIDVGRGCPCRCTFCATNDFWQRTSRFRSTESSVRTIKDLHDGRGFHRFAFLHDTLTISRGRAMDLCEAIRREKLDITWECSTRTDCLDDELLDRMAEAGCTRMLIGIETGSPRMQRLTKKGLDPEHVVGTCRSIARSGMSFHASFVVGFPQETMGDLVETIRLMTEVRFAGNGDESISLELLRPILGSEIYEEHHPSLLFDGYYADIAVARSAEENGELIRRHPDVFAPFHYLVTPFLDRDMLVQSAHLFRVLCRLPYTLYVLWRAEELDFPRMLLSRLPMMDMPRASQVQFRDVAGPAMVVRFLETCLVRSGFGHHYVVDVLRYESAVSRVGAVRDDHPDTVVEELRYDVEGLIEEIASKRIAQLPRSLPEDRHWLLFTRGSSGICTTRVPSRVAELFCE